MSNLLRFVLIVFLFVFITFFGFSYFSLPSDINQTNKIEFTIQTGETLNEIIENLKSQGLIRSVTVAKVRILISGLSTKIQAGYFYLSPSQNLQEIISNLTTATSKQVWVTIPEGMRRQEIAKIINDAFTKSGGNPEFQVNKFILKTNSLEGHLFPDTYAFNPDSTTEDIINKLTKQFDKVVRDLSIPSSKLESTLILASLLERESRQASEMLEIAGILKKRLANDWPLQIDATIQFVLANQQQADLSSGYWSKTITKQDLDISSPYNTYKHLGLPPAPICNPGKNALQASFKATTSKYWFYLHDLQGNIHFATTVEEHNRNICRYLKKDC